MISLSNLNKIIYLIFLISIQIYFYYLNKIKCECYNEEKWDIRYIKKTSLILLIIFGSISIYNLVTNNFSLGKIFSIIIFPIQIIIKFLINIGKTLLKSILVIAIVSYILRTKNCECTNKWQGKLIKLLCIYIIISFILSSIGSFSTLFILIVAVTISFVFGMLFSKKISNSFSLLKLT